MLVALGFYRRKKGMSYEDFSSYWRNVQGPLVRNHPEAQRYIRRYVQHHLSPNDFGNVADLPFDGFSEVWYESRDDRERLINSQGFIEDLVSDEAKFLDLGQARISMFDRQIIQITGEL